MRARRDVAFYECFGLSHRDASARRCGRRRMPRMRVLGRPGPLECGPGTSDRGDRRDCPYRSKPGCPPWNRSRVSRTFPSQARWGSSPDVISAGSQPWRIEMKTTYRSRRRTTANGRTIGSIPFASTCPKCAQVRPERAHGIIIACERDQGYGERTR